MVSHFFVLVLSLSIVILDVCFGARLSYAGTPLRVLTYDSLAAKSGLGPVLLEEWARHQKDLACDLELISAGGSGQMLARLALEARKRPVDRKIHVVLGLDPDAAANAQKSDWIAPWSRWRPTRWNSLRPEVKDTPLGLLPFDFGVLTMIARGGDQTEVSVKEFNSPSLKGKWVLQDPRTSAVGFGFIRALFEITGSKAAFFEEWNKLKGSWVTLAPGWSEAYGFFLKQKVDWVWSFTTSQAYHHTQGESQYRAVLFKEGNPIYVDYAAMVKGAFSEGSKQSQCARSFLSLLLSTHVQSQIPGKQWMYPVIPGPFADPKLEAHFKALPLPRILLKKPAEIKLDELF